MRNAKRHSCILFNEKNRNAKIFIDLDDLFEYCANKDWSNAERRFIEKEQARLRHQRSADGKHLLFSPAKGAARLPDALFQSWENREDIIQIFLNAVRIFAEIPPGITALSFFTSRTPPASSISFRSVIATDSS